MKIPFLVFLSLCLLVSCEGLHRDSRPVSIGSSRVLSLKDWAEECFEDHLVWHDNGTCTVCFDFGKASLTCQNEATSRAHFVVQTRRVYENLDRYASNLYLYTPELFLTFLPSDRTPMDVSISLTPYVWKTLLDYSRPYQRTIQLSPFNGDPSLKQQFRIGWSAKSGNGVTGIDDPNVDATRQAIDSLALDLEFTSVSGPVPTGFHVDADVQYNIPLINGDLFALTLTDTVSFSPLSDKMGACDTLLLRGKLIDDTPFFVDVDAVLTNKWGGRLTEQAHQKNFLHQEGDVFEMPLYLKLPCALRGNPSQVILSFRLFGTLPGRDQHISSSDYLQAVDLTLEPLNH